MQKAIITHNYSPSIGKLYVFSKQGTSIQTLLSDLDKAGIPYKKVKDVQAGKKFVNRKASKLAKAQGAKPRHKIQFSNRQHRPPQPHCTHHTKQNSSTPHDLPLSTNCNKAPFPSRGGECPSGRGVLFIIA